MVHTMPKFTIIRYSACQGGIEQRLIQKKRQRSSLLVGGRLAARMIWRQVFERISILVGWWFGLMWLDYDMYIFFKAFFQVTVILFIHFFKSSWCKIASDSVPQTAATTFAFSSVFILHLFQRGWAEFKLYQQQWEELGAFWFLRLM